MRCCLTHLGSAWLALWVSLGRRGICRRGKAVASPEWRKKEGRKEGGRKGKGREGGRKERGREGEGQGDFGAPILVTSGRQHPIPSA